MGKLFPGCGVPRGHRTTQVADVPKDAHIAALPDTGAQGVLFRHTNTSGRGWVRNLSEAVRVDFDDSWRGVTGAQRLSIRSSA
jgi:hypothetical protein